MRLKLSELRRLIREAVHDTMMAHTEPVEASPESLKVADHASLGGQNNPLTAKVNQVMKVFARQGKQVNANDVKKLLSTVDPQRLLVLTADQVAAQVAKKLAS